MAVAPAAMADMNGYDILKLAVRHRHRDHCRPISSSSAPHGAPAACTVVACPTALTPTLTVSSPEPSTAARRPASTIRARRQPLRPKPGSSSTTCADTCKSVLILDWEAQDNTAWGDKQWPRRWAREVKRLTGVNPIIYTMDSGYWQVAGMETELNCGIWIAQ